MDIDDDVNTAVLCHLDGYGTLDPDGVILFESVDVLLTAFCSLADAVHLDRPDWCSRRWRDALRKVLLHIKDLLEQHTLQ